MKTLMICISCWIVIGINCDLQAAKPMKVDGLYYTISGENTVNVVGSEREDTVLEIPSEVMVNGKNYTVTGIENHLLDINGKGIIKRYGWGRSLKKVVVPNTVKRIGESAFAYQPFLESIELPTSVQSIGGMAFNQCCALKRIRIPEGITVIAAFLFDGCENLQEVILPASLQKINLGAFHDCASLTDIEIPEKVDEIDGSAFNNCGIWALDLSHTNIHTLNLGCVSNSSLGYVSFPIGVTQFSGNPFANEKCLYNIDYATLEALSQNGNWNFLNKIHHLVIRNAKTVEKNYCPELETLVLTGAIREVGRSAMKGSSHLKKVYLDGFQIRESESEKTFRIRPSCITEIGEHAFSECRDIITVEFPQTLVSIGDGAFFGCKKLERIDLPLSLECIDRTAFWDCVSLQVITGLNSSISYGYDVSDPFLGVPNFNLKRLQKLFSYFALGYLKRELQEWERKKEFETTAQWKERVTAGNRDKRVKEWMEHAKKAYIAQAKIPALKVTLGSYDADYNTYRLEADQMGTVYVHVPIGEAPAFKDNFGRAGFIPTYGIQNDSVALTDLDVTVNGKTYRSMDAVKEDNRDLMVQLPPLSINFGQDNNTADASMPSVQRQAVPSDVDENIPITSHVATQTFAVVIANENYVREAQVPFALRDGEVFAEYCRKTLGIPEKNIRVVKDATLNDMKFQFDWLRQILGAYNGHARAIVYYAGHGIPDETNQSACLLPVDGYGSNVGTGFALKDFYAMLNSAPAECVTVFLDACFSGTKRESGMMATARGVAIKVKEESPKGNMVVFTAAQGDETAYQYAEKGHGMFTYFLLKKLQESKGSVTLGELSDYISGEVRKSSILINNKMQTPTTIASPGMAGWRDNTLK